MLGSLLGDLEWLNSILFFLQGDLFMKSANFFVAAAFVSFVFSVTLWFAGDSDLNRQQAIFVGLWVPSILSLGNLLK